MEEKQQPKQKKKKEEEPQTLSQSLFGWLQAVVPVIIGIILVFTFVGRLTPVDGDSMNPTLHHGDMLVVA